MGVNSSLIYALNRTIELAGTPIRVEYFKSTIGSIWDDESTYAKSGASVWTSGVVFPLSTREGSNDSNLVAQGKLIDSDKKLYVNGSLALTGSDNAITLMLGSPGDLYTSVPVGGIMWSAEASPVYKAAYIRRLTTGSLL